MKKRNATVALLLAMGLVGGLLLGGVLNAPAPDLKAGEALEVAAQAAHAGGAATVVTENDEKLAELREFAGKLETLFQTVADEVSPAVVLIESQVIVRRRGRGPLDEFFGSPFEFFGSPFSNRDRFRPMPEQQRRTTQVGSGFILDEEGHILTNNHVVRDTDGLKVQLADGREFEAEVVGTDAETDLAVIQIQGEPSDLPTVALGDSDEVKAGQWVLAVGNPFGLRHTVSAGIVSATGRSIGAANYESMIQTDAAINRGNSGGPLVNLKCEVIGINAAIVGGSGGNIGIGFAIPINMAKDILDDLLAGRQVVRGYLGIQISPLKPEMAEAFDYEGSGGALVHDVAEDSAASRAGIQAGDIVTEYQGRSVENANELRRRVAGTDPGATVVLKLWRDGREKTVTAKLGNLAEAVDWLGLTVQPLTEQMAAEIGRADLEGVLVADVAEDSIAANRIRPGDVIRSVNLIKIRNPEQYQKLITAVKPGQSVPLHVYSRQAGSAYFFAFRRPATR